MENNIHYLYHAQTGIELIFCKNSTISYPLHNHVSVLTIGIILDGSVVLTQIKKQGFISKMKHLLYSHMYHIAFHHITVIPCLACALIRML